MNTVCITLPTNNFIRWWVVAFHPPPPSSSLHQQIKQSSCGIGKPKTPRLWHSKDTLMWWVQTRDRIPLLTVDKVLCCCFTPCSFRQETADTHWTYWNSIWSWLMLFISQVTGCCFSPNGLYIVSVSTDKTFRVWEAQTGRWMLTECSFVTCYAISRDGLILITGQTTGTVILQDTSVILDMLCSRTCNWSSNITDVIFRDNSSEENAWYDCASNMECVLRTQSEPWSQLLLAWSETTEWQVCHFDHPPFVESSK